MEQEYTIEYLTQTPEGPYLDRKSSRIEPKDIVKHVIAFANANGGALAIGIEDNGTLTGFMAQKSHFQEEYKDAIVTNCRPIPSYSFQSIQYGLDDGEYVLVIKVEAYTNQVVRKIPSNEVYLRISDKSRKLDHEQITKLEYDKGQRFFEEIEVPDATIQDDIDETILQMYMDRMGADKHTSSETVLNARGLIRNKHLTNAAILLFGKNPTKFLPQARVRFIRYDGVKSLTGQRINIIKERTFDSAIPLLLTQVAEFMRTQMRDFQFLDDDGQFKMIPEYPEFAWFEGIVNALTHRDYSVSGDHIRISMYDDRIEIFSPGKLPNIVTLENMKYTRFSRNPKIARILTEFGWVKELNEGVNRIYDEMQSFFLNAPRYSEPNNRAVLLILENSITSRNMRIAEQLSGLLKDQWNILSVDEKRILQYVYFRGKVKVKDVAIKFHMSIVTTRKKLKNLVAKNLLHWRGNSTRDPHQYYEI